jgi:hypothetical protein
VEQFKIQAMAELVAERAQECSERGNVFEDRSAQPHADELRLGVVVAEQLHMPQPPSRIRIGRAASTRTGGPGNGRTSTHISSTTCRFRKNGQFPDPSCPASERRLSPSFFATATPPWT